MIEHRVWRGVAIVRPTMHFAAGDDVDSRDLLFQDGGLRGPQLRIREITRRPIDRSSQDGPWLHTNAARYARRSPWSYTSHNAARPISP